MTPVRHRRKKIATPGLVEARWNVDDVRERIRALSEAGLALVEAHRRSLGEAIDESTTTINSDVHVGDSCEAWSWQSDRWATWRPTRPTHSPNLRVGEFDEKHAGSAVHVPAIIQLIGSEGPLVITSQGPVDRLAGNALVQSMVARLALSHMHGARFTFLDPSGDEATFGAWRDLPNATFCGPDRFHELDNVLRDIKRISSSHLGGQYFSFEQLPAPIRLSERFHFIIAAGDVSLYGTRAIETLQAIARLGPRSGVYPIIHHSHPEPDERQETGVVSSEWPNATTINLSQPTATFGELIGSISVDDGPSDSLTMHIIERLTTVLVAEPMLRWDDLGGPTESDWWGESIESQLAATIGATANNDPLVLDLGSPQTRSGRGAHVVIMGQQTADRCALFHSLILGLCTQFDPSKLRLYLVISRNGLDMSACGALPHAAIVSQNTSPTTAGSIVHDLASETRRRNELLLATGSLDLVDYMRAGGRDVQLPRLLVVIDDFEQLIDDGSAKDLAYVLDQGRHTGVHVLLGSPGNGRGLCSPGSSIVKAIQTRVALQLPTSRIGSLVEFGALGRRLVATHCDRPGRIVVNDRFGDEHGSVAGHAAMLSPDERDDLVNRLAAKANQTGMLLAPITIDGSAPPRFVSHPHVRRLVAAKEWPSVEQLSRSMKLADPLPATTRPRRPTEEQPIPCFLGAVHGIDGRAVALLSRRQHDHLAIVGADPHVRIGMAAAAMMSAAVFQNPKDLRIWACDGGSSGAAWSRTLGRTSRLLAGLGARTQLATSRDESGALITEVAKFVRQRAARATSVSGADRTILLVLHEPDRIPSLLRTRDDHSAVGPMNPDLREIIDQGPALGVHLIVASPSLNTLLAVIDDSALQRSIRYRAVLRMPDLDSYSLIRSSAATRLRVGEDGSTEAVLFDALTERSTFFGPYSTAAPGDRPDSTQLDDDLIAVASALAIRGHN